MAGTLMPFFLLTSLYYTGDFIKMLSYFLVYLPIALSLQSIPSAQDNYNDYFFIRNARRYCDGNSIIQATGENDIQNAIDLCNGLDKCTFLCQNSLYENTLKPSYQFNESIVAVNGTLNVLDSAATWFCSDNYWKGIYPKYGWTIAIKGEAIYSESKTFDFGLNASAICAKDNILHVARNQTPKEAADLCTEIKSCTFFSMSLEIDKGTGAFCTRTIFCSGVPESVHAVEGNLYASLRTAFRARGAKIPRLKRSSTSLVYYGGPVINDNYHSVKKRGEILPATQL
ncbi:hypothetical protein BdWA1_002769 [Babesia duncani]|uniref:Uncharacterized protein n=1 Tax=Babesia duncani TaxID=323732 RepID=A0AAD9PJU8_9APIC|nr:hypothetical protein BdWA1_002769 [Babesia duncani]